jgi:hypothetical protein
MAVLAADPQRSFRAAQDNGAAMSFDKPSTTPLVPPIQPCWRLLAVALDPDRSTPELYGAICEAENDVPLMVNGRIVFFTDPARAPELIQKHGGPWATDPMDVAKPSFWCDVAQTLHFLSAGGIDTTASVVDAVNVLLDLVRATGTEIDDRRRKALYAIADYCTTNTDLTRYFEEVGDYSSDELVDAVLWCIGAVVAMARIL